MNIETILQEANLTEAQIAQIVEIVQEAKDSTKAEIRARHSREIIALSEGKDAVIGALMAELRDGQTALDESVKASERKFRATITADTGVGIDVDTDGTLAFTVTSKNGVAELSKPDSIAVKKWFNSLIEEARKAKAALKEDDDGDEGGDEDDDSESEDNELNESKVLARVDAILAEALEPVLLATRKSNAYHALAARMEMICESVTPHLVPEILEESRNDVLSRDAALTAALEESQAENRALRQAQIFADKTKGLALTRVEKVKLLTESTNFKNDGEYSDFVDVAIRSTANAAPTQVEDLNEGRKPESTSAMKSYLDKL